MERNQISKNVLEFCDEIRKMTNPEYNKFMKSVLLLDKIDSNELKVIQLLCRNEHYYCEEDEV